MAKPYHKDHDLNKLGSILPWNAFIQIPAFLTNWILRRIFFKDNNNLIIPNYLSFNKGEAFHFNKLELPVDRDALSQVWLNMVHWFGRKSQKCKKFTDGQTGRRTSDQTLSEKLTLALISSKREKYAICLHLCIYMLNILLGTT